MADLFNVASSALLSYRRALDTVGHNIANVNTPGYSRQAVELAARGGVGSGGGFYGSGVAAINVSRLQDPFAADRLIHSLSSAGQAQVAADFAGRIDRMLSDPASGLAQPLRAFIAAVDGVSADPASIIARQLMLSEAQSLASRFDFLDGRVATQAAEIEQRLDLGVRDINGLSSAIAQLNTSIVRATGESGGKAPNDLLDQRDELLRRLAGQLEISTVAQDDGALNVFAAGQALVLGTRAATLGVAEGPYGPGEGRIVLQSGGGAVDVSNQLQGGELGGLLEARRQIIAPARAELGRLAVAIADLANGAQAAGVDLAGERGQELFAAAAPEAAAHRANSGSAVLLASLADPASSSGRDHVLRFDGSVWSISEHPGGASLSLSGSGSVSDPFLVAGLSVTVSGSAAAGDSFLLRAAGGGSAPLTRTLADAAQIAAAAPLRAHAATGNAGLAGASVQVIDPSVPMPSASVLVEFDSAGSYRIDGGAAVAWAPGDVIDHAGWRLQLDGLPASGDRFEVSATGANSGDNRNLQALHASLLGGYFDGGTVGLQAAHAQTVGRSAVAAQQAELRSAASGAIAESDLARLESVSGVNLDEEAADLLRYEQAYQAAARVIATAESMFQTLLDAVRR